jgi:hypothetical protein
MILMREKFISELFIPPILGMRIHFHGDFISPAFVSLIPE